MHLLTKKLFNTNYNHTFVLLNNEVIKTLSINLKLEEEYFVCFVCPDFSCGLFTNYRLECKSWYELQ